MTSLPRFRPSRLAATLVLGLLIFGCGGDQGGDDSSSPSSDPSSDGGDTAPLSVVVDPETASPGDRLQARVLNETEEDFTYGLSYELEREVDGGFELVKTPPRAVIQIGLIAKPGRQGPPVRVEVPDDAEPGTWRVVLLRDLPEVGDLAAEFEVVG